jgi:uncharacterized protein
MPTDPQRTRPDANGLQQGPPYFDAAPDLAVPEPGEMLTAQPAPLAATMNDADENPVWSGWDVVLFAVIAFGSLVIVGGIAGAVYVAMHGLKAEAAGQLDSDLRFILPVQLFGYGVMIITMIAIVRNRYQQRFLSAVRWHAAGMQTWKFVAVGVGLAVLAQISELVLRMPKDLPMQKFFTTATGAYLMGFFGVLVAPFVEELFFRGFLYPVAARSLHSAGQTAAALALPCALISAFSKTARAHMFELAVIMLAAGLVLIVLGKNFVGGDAAVRRVRMLAGIAVTAVSFALVHAAQLGYSWTPLLVMFVVGAALTTVRAVTKSVAASTVTHMTYNFVLMATLWIATNHFHNLERITR